MKSYNMYDMDKIDQSILSFLYQDGRMTNAKLALQLGINKATIARRKERMLSDKLFVIRAVRNPFKMINKARAFIALSVDLKKVNEVCTTLVNNPRISTVVTAFGKYNILIYLEFMNWELLIEYIKNEISTLEGLKDIEVSLISEFQKRSWHFFESDKSDDSKPLGIDDIDYKLMDELGENGSMKFEYLAKKLNVSTATVSRRISSLLDKKIIKIVAVPNPSKLGSHITSFIHLRIEKDKLKDVCKELSKYPEVHTIMTSISHFDIFIRVGFPTSELMHEFISERIAYIDGVLNTNTYIRAEIKKILYSPGI